MPDTDLVSVVNLLVLKGEWQSEYLDYYKAIYGASSTPPLSLTCQ